MLTIEFLAAINNQHYYCTDEILTILTQEPQKLALGTDFIGKPVTKIYTDEITVVKIHAELDLDPESAKKWTNQVLIKERQLNVYHPHKTWFLLIDDTKHTIKIGNICPRLRPLHSIFKVAPQNETEYQYYLNLLSQVFEKYLITAKNQAHKLDEGLSNFAVSNSNEVYYLDDDYYFWDNFISFSVMLGVYIRNLKWLNEIFITKLAKTLVKHLNNIFQDPNCQIIIAHQLDAVFIPNQHKKQLLTAFINVLNTPTSKPKLKLKLPEPILPAKKPSRYLAIFADVHANYPALETVLDFYKQQDITKGLILGDIVGYGPDPTECIDRLQNTDFTIIKGNHDHSAAINNTERGFSKNSKAIIDWTIKQLSSEHKQWLQDLPSFHQTQDWFAVHGAPMDPAFFYGYVYIMTITENLDYLTKHKIRRCFHGHSHIPGVYTLNKLKQEKHFIDEKISLKKHLNSLICPGSVGQPRNKNSKAQCAVFDTQEDEMTFINLEYPIDKVVKKMQHHDFPEQLWKRLYDGI